MIKKYLRIAAFLSSSLFAQDATLTEKDVPKKVIQSRNKKAAHLKHKTTTWTKNAAGEYVAELKIGAGELGPDQSITGRFHENGTWLETEMVISPYASKLRKKLLPKNIAAVCLKLVKKSGAEEISGPVTIRDMPGKFTVEAHCGEKRVTFDKKAKILKEE